MLWRKRQIQRRNSQWIARRQLTHALSPLVGRRFDPAGIPKVGVKADHREASELTKLSRKRGFASAAASQHDDPLHPQDIIIAWARNCGFGYCHERPLDHTVMRRRLVSKWV